MTNVEKYVAKRIERIAAGGGRGAPDVNCRLREEADTLWSLLSAAERTEAETAYFAAASAEMRKR